jgi:hypothetical protein
MCSSRVTATRMMRWAESVARIQTMRRVHKVTVVRHKEWEGTAWVIYREWEDNTKMNLKYIPCDGVAEYLCRLSLHTFLPTSRIINFYFIRHMHSPSSHFPAKILYTYIMFLRVLHACHIILNLSNYYFFGKWCILYFEAFHYVFFFL